MAMILTSALLCLSLNIYHESRGEPIIGQYAVANVTMNRAGQDRRKVCSVVLQKSQFSWTNKLVSNGYLKQSGTPRDLAAWITAQKIATVALSGKLHGFDFTHGAKYYHANYVSPKWSKTMQTTKVIGRHIFYKVA